MTQKPLSVRQKTIVECVRKIIGSKGMGSLTIHELSRELKVTDGAIYRHFKSKNEILSALINDIETTLFNAISQAAIRQSDPVNKLKEIFSTHVSYAEQRKGVTFIVINETLNLNDKKLQTQMNSVVQRYLEKIAAVLKAGIETGSFRKDLDAFSASIAFFGMVQSLITLWSLNEYDDQLIRRAMPKVFDLFLKGILK